MSLLGLENLLDEVVLDLGRKMVKLGSGACEKRREEKVGRAGRVSGTAVVQTGT